MTPREARLLARDWEQNSLALRKGLEDVADHLDVILEQIWGIEGRMKELEEALMRIAEFKGINMLPATECVEIAREALGL